MHPKNYFFSAISSAFLLLALASCGGGGGSSAPPPPPPPAAPSGLSYTTPQTYTVNVAATTLNPTVTGSVTSYAVSPALPAGLSINAGTGAISGTPTALQAQTNHTVTASNAGGSTNATLSITVNDVVPSIDYPQTTYSLVAGTTITAITPTATGGPVVTWTVNPALPAGLTLNAANGQISGTPAAATASTTYTVTAQNSGGNDTFALQIRVRAAPGVLLELGHSAISAVVFKGDRIVTADFRSSMALWNAQTGVIIRRFSGSCSTTCGAAFMMAGQTIAVRNETGFDLYSTVDGALRTQIASPSANTRWALSSDGTYIISQGFQRLTAWNVNGTQLFTVDGNFYDAGVFAAPGEIRAANGPGAAQRVLTIAVPAGTSTVGPLFTGTFHSWFEDGARFFTAAGNTLRIYSNATVEADVANLAAFPTKLAGFGNWYHGELQNELKIWAVGSAGVTAANYPLGTVDQVRGTGNTLALLPYQIPQMSVIDLAGAAPVKTDFVTPVASLTNFAAVSATDWVFSASGGAMFGELGAGPPQRYSYGEVRAMAGGTARVVIALANGEILHFAANTQALEGRIDFAIGDIQLSADGTVLAASATPFQSQYVPDRTLRVYSLPSRNLITQFPFTFGVYPQLGDFALSRDGQVVAQYLSGAGSERWLRAYRLDHTPLLDEMTPRFMVLTESPELVVSDSGSGVSYPETSVGAGNASGIYVNGARTSAAIGWPAAWLDDSRILMNRYRGMPGEYAFDGADIVNSSGQLLAQPPVLEMRRPQIIGTNTAYSPEHNIIVNVTTGDTLWSSASPISNLRSQNRGAVAGDFVYYVSGDQVLFEAR